MIAIADDILIDTDKATHIWDLRFAHSRSELYRSSKGNYYTLFDPMIDTFPNIKIRKITKQDAALLLTRAKLLKNPEIELPEELVGLCEVE